MPAFEVMWLRWLFILTVIGIFLVIFFYLGFYLPNLPGQPPGKHSETEKWPADIEETSRGIPSILWLLFAIMFAYFIGHFLLVWLRNLAF